jgi:hypothetical protein
MLAGISPPPLLGGKGACFSAQAVITSLGLWSTAAGTGGPLLYNGTTPGSHGSVTAYIMSVSYGLTVASTIAGAIGITGGATTAPTTTTAITSTANLWLGGAASKCSVYSIGTVSTAGTFFLPTGQTGTGAITVDTADDNFIHLGGCIVVPPGYFCAVAADAILTAGVFDIGMTWIEMPND